MNSIVVCLDELGPESAKTYPGHQSVRAIPTADRPVERAHYAADYGRRGGGSIFGAFQPATGEAFTAPYTGRTIANWCDFLDQVATWLPSAAERVWVVLDNLSTHRAADVLLWSLTHPTWEFVFQPTYAAYLNLIEPWWKILRSLAFAGRRFADWEAMTTAVKRATAYWNAHRHPFVWGRRRRHQPRRTAGIGLLPKVA